MTSDFSQVSDFAFRTQLLQWGYLVARFLYVNVQSCHCDESAPSAGIVVKTVIDTRHGIAKYQFAETLVIYHFSFEKILSQILTQSPLGRNNIVIFSLFFTVVLISINYILKNIFKKNKLLPRSPLGRYYLVVLYIFFYKFQPPREFSFF